MEKKELRRYVTAFVWDCSKMFEEKLFETLKSDEIEWYISDPLLSAAVKLEEEAMKRLNDNPEKLIKDMCEFWNVDSLIVIDPDLNKRYESEYEVVWVKPKEIK